MREGKQKLFSIITSALLALVGLFLFFGGAQLMVLGGSWFYVLAGCLLLAVAVAGVKAPQLAMRVYAAFLVVATIWALTETGFNIWGLEVRLLAPIGFGAWMLLPWVWRSGGNWLADKRDMLGAIGLAVVVLVISCFTSYSIDGTVPDDRMAAQGQADPAADGVADADWQAYGRTMGGDRYSPLAQITRGNVSHLKRAWVTRTGDVEQDGEGTVAGPDQGHEFNLEVTPLKVGDTLYMCTPHSWVMALDATTGKVKWKFDPHPDTADLAKNVYLACRGVSYYRIPDEIQTSCRTRIYSPVADVRIVALDAETGKPCDDFGDHGFISMRAYLGHVPHGFHFITSPPLVAKNRLITGGWIFDNQANFEPSGAIRAFDATTGEIAWAWDAGHSPETWKPGPTDVLTRDTPNAWGVYTADPALGMVYIPTGNAPPDNWGGSRRPFDDATSSATIALDIVTGERRWTYQTVHHDLWDMDIPSGPSMVELPGPNGESIPALVQSTKRGEFFVLDRRTGAPVPGYPVEERPVPTAGAAPDDRVSPTQPYPAAMPSLTPPNLKESDMWGATLLDQMICRIQYRQSAYEGQFTPPHVGRTTIVYPAFYGVVDWQGITIDPQRKIMLANASYLPFRIKLEKRQGLEGKGVLPRWNGQGEEPAAKGDALSVSPDYGTPYIALTNPWLNPLQIPCKGPVWGTITAIDLVTKKIVWQHPVGTTRDTGPFRTHNNLPLPTGMYNIGGSIVTRGGLVFMGATADDYLRAFDLATGKVIWTDRLPAGGQATPMSYEIGGKQYVLIAAGGHGGLGTRSGDYIIAYTLDGEKGAASAQ
ncbi:membrane-bound PQQ-dependent dehydrogenase, glucose/quinate/shikimate family [Komagataeibacter rhaeticus]|uniref:membrane-bound PQQ-dependent dehydrogenase, glucose/quinate/shikimate family n=1 Tax=Komagataeibacter rhaeticus TaxID=215221 RepID=UPI0004D5C9E5|nr:membrane-bound PQQ-dependent dehydrogenase, glucose/quinate/shikimate family [Komagataeibacter rhaeticus]KDU96424.1 glucose dehydrogenase [Komagataeibacter rhaeticus AF1]MBL7240076.1 membrane-bound PQQ-dependent dehydrogenase, glucose/quinate/shikimate family [Komagataeibacter rhaeticus]PYD54843.1 membrane-bound PQQ-dependent dehydrogenase, glucose/quinate/shikimate family [Komagataeibacter rhaeticus]GBQ10805.1 PQQ-dependent dehydrogenase 4 [Komagataeibacter rhaeticus DSM 16663]